jgi:hypothetical protein
MKPEGFGPRRDASARPCPPSSQISETAGERLIVPSSSDSRRDCTMPAFEPRHAARSSGDAGAFTGDD